LGSREAALPLRAILLLGSAAKILPQPQPSNLLRKSLNARALSREQAQVSMESAVTATRSVKKRRTFRGERGKASHGLYCIPLSPRMVQAGACQRSRPKNKSCSSILISKGVQVSPCLARRMARALVRPCAFLSSIALLAARSGQAKACSRWPAAVTRHRHGGARRRAPLLTGKCNPKPGRYRLARRPSLMSPLHSCSAGFTLALETDFRASRLPPLDPFFALLKAASIADCRRPLGRMRLSRVKRIGNGGRGLFARSPNFAERKERAIARIFE